MQDHVQRKENIRPRWVGNLERAAGDLNAVLLALAIGLAALDLTCFCAFQVRDALPSPSRFGVQHSLVGHPAMPASHTVAALAATRPGVEMTGW